MLQWVETLEMLGWGECILHVDTHESLGATGKTAVSCIKAPQDVHVLIPGTYEYYLRGKDFAEVINLIILRWKIILEYPGGP